jgi:AraC-like DNA-binding protein
MFVGDWRCPGERRTWTKETTDDVVLELPRQGAHLCALAVGSRERERHVVDATTVAVQSPSDPVSIASPTAQPRRSTLLYLRGALVEELDLALPARVCRLSSASALLHLRLLAARGAMDIEESALALAAGVREDCARGQGSLHALTPRSSWRRLSEEIQHVVATRYSERLSLGEIARACKVSPFHASRAFRAVVGETIHRHLTRVRLRVALLELAHGGGRLTEVALRAGFSSHSHFTDAFRAEFRVLPSSLARRQPLRRR